MLPTGCYRIFHDPANFTQADDTCAQQNGYLASWETRDEFAMVKTFLERKFCKYTFKPFCVFVQFIWKQNHIHLSHIDMMYDAGN